MGMQRSVASRIDTNFMERPNGPRAASFKRLLGGTCQRAAPLDPAHSTNRDHASEEDVLRRVITALLGPRGIERLAFERDRISPTCLLLRFDRHPCAVVVVEIGRVEQAEYPDNRRRAHE